MRSAKWRAIRKVKTKAENICDFFRGLSGKVEVVFEEGTHSAWLHKLIKPLVASVTVCDPRHNKLIEDGDKSDDEQQQLKELCRAYENLVQDTTSAKNRLQTIYRGRGLDPGHNIYRADQRDQWLAKLEDEATRFRAESLLDQLTALQELRKQVKKRFVLRVRQHLDYQILSGLPGFGPVRVGQLGEDRQIAEEGFDSWVEPESQPTVEAGFQRRGAGLSPL